ncbi:hypothetical protein VHEMI02766 [[Torrubiella] hemipterigena]|uniref:HypA-like protein n=1 Tax=[Torrubiella] hemipterigena TaxID=1531966 RepID=A0A0A1T8X4_9HYPO|nr:hypothetical protein VHEMI02766 [[Torrubiella] hemipterigena]
MATSSRVQVADHQTGLLAQTQTSEAANVVSSLLQRDMEGHHVYFNDRGFHNHIPHHLLSLYGTGCTVQNLQDAYTLNAAYQIKSKESNHDILKELQEDFDTAFINHAGNSGHYSSFLAYFQQQVAAIGVEACISKYLFGSGETAEAMFRRLFAGVLHPLIQLMFGLEWEQPAIVAEALAQIAIHREEIGGFFADVEIRAAQLNASGGTSHPVRSVIDILEAAHAEHPALVAAGSPEFMGSLYGPLVDGSYREELLDLLAAISVDPTCLDERIDEMVHTCAYVCSATAFCPPYQPKFDFFFIHRNNASPFFIWLKTQDWIAQAHKIRLLEWKLRGLVLEYLSRGSPPLRLDNIRSYVPKDIQRGKAETPVTSPEILLPRFHASRDDGHVIKVARSFLLAQKLTQPHLDKPKQPAWLRLVDDESWLKAHYILLDATEGVEGLGLEGNKIRWVYGIGFEESWRGSRIAGMD